MKELNSYQTQVRNFEDPRTLKHTKFKSQCESINFS